jgi:hypothetical protein
MTEKISFVTKKLFSHQGRCISISVVYASPLKENCIEWIKERKDHPSVSSYDYEIEEIEVKGIIKIDPVSKEEAKVKRLVTEPYRMFTSRAAIEAAITAQDEANSDVNTKKLVTILKMIANDFLNHQLDKRVEEEGKMKEIYYVRLMADFESSGLWNKEGSMMDPDDLPVSDNIKRKIKMWADYYTLSDNMDPADITIFSGIGELIARDIKKALWNCKVVYFNLHKSLRMPKDRSFFEYEITL